MDGENILNSFTHAKIFNMLYTHYIRRWQYKEKIRTVGLYTYCSMNKQYMEGDTKIEKILMLVNITMWPNLSLTGSETMSLPVKDQRGK